MGAWMVWQQIAVLVGVLSPMVGVPLAVITLYLRAIREHQTTTMAEIQHRIEVIEASVRDLVRATADFEREYATKEEWVRESMLARQHLERLTEMVARIEADLDGRHAVSVELTRATEAMLELARGTAERLRPAAAEMAGG
jgi:hypothetical protein